MWIQQRVQLSWTQTGTLGRRQTASLSWPFTPTQTAVAAGVEVWEMVTPTARGAQGVRRTRTPTDSLSRRLMVLPSSRRMTSNLYSAYSRWMSPVLCVLVSPKGLYIEYVHTVYCVYIYVCVEWLSACHTDLNASAYILVDWNQTRPWETSFFLVQSILIYRLHCTMWKTQLFWNNITHRYYFGGWSCANVVSEVVQHASSVRMPCPCSLDVQ